MFLELVITFVKKGIINFQSSGFIIEVIALQNWKEPENFKLLSLFGFRVIDDFNAFTKLTSTINKYISRNENTTLGRCRSVRFSGLAKDIF